jgi:hypothetical protein
METAKVSTVIVSDASKEFTKTLDLTRYDSGFASAETIRYEVAVLIDRLLGLRGPEGFAEWMAAPHKDLGKKSPAEMIEDGKMNRLWELVIQMKGGAPV